MSTPPPLIAQFLTSKRIAVVGVSRNPRQTANAILRKLRGVGYEVVPINPFAAELEGTRCYPELSAAPDGIDGVLIATHPRVAVEVVQQCAARGISRVWMHRSFGQGSVSPEAVRECQARGIQCIVGGCPLMYCPPVDIAHRCFRWLLGLQGRLPR